MTAAIAPLEPYRTDFPEALARLDEWQRDATARRARLSLAHTPLSIGVMGQVKAGKSSFLNSLLFGGRALLPEAATPKTANLTRIRHAAQPSFTARFYRPQDWARLEKLAAAGGHDDASRAARELVQSAQASGADIAALLGQEQITLAAQDLDGLLGQLNDYVGSDGSLTALVAETELALPLPELEGIEIVDTPGMNDPVASRTDKTRDYMAQCDVVFFLSRSSQFLPQSDQALMALQLPQKGVKRLVLVAAQFDMAVLDDGFNRPSLQACSSRLAERLTRHAQSVFSQLAQDREQQGNTDTAQLLSAVSTPIFASTHAWAIAHQPPEAWNAGVRHTHEQLTELAEDSWNAPLTPGDWEQLANFTPLQDALHQARADKQAILAQQRATLEASLSAERAECLRQLHEQAQSRLNALQHHDLSNLQAREQAQQTQLDKVSTALAGVLHGAASQAQQRSHELAEDMRQQAAQARQLDERTGYKSERHVSYVSTSTWYKPWTWGSSRREVYYETKAYPYLATADAVEKLRGHVQQMRRQLTSAFDDLIAPRTLSAQLRHELLRSIDPGSKDFDAQGLRAMVETSLGGLQLPELVLEEPNVERVFAGFPSEVKNHDDMQRLRQKLAEAVDALEAGLSQSLSTGVARSAQSLNDTAAHLQSLLTERLRQSMEQLRLALADKTRHIERMQALMQTIGTL